MLSRLIRLNKTLLGATLIMCVVGIVAIYSATHMREGRWEGLTELWRKQAIWVAVGLVIHFVVSTIDYHWVSERWGGWIVYIAGLALLIATQFFGEIRSNARSWLDLGVLDLQTSQVAILGGILAIAILLNKDFADLQQWQRILLCGALVGGPFLLILIQPDLGSALVWLPVLFTMFIVGGIQKRWLMSLVLLGLICAPVAYFLVLKPYQVDRLLVFLDPENIKWRQNEGWGIWNSLLAIGSGGMEGKGFLSENSQNYLGFLPIATAPTDYIFAVLAEEHGFRGAAILIGIFAILLISGLWIAWNAIDHLGKLIASGICALLFTHIFLNIGMVISLVPITGLPLPLVSYGGSFAVLILFCLGLLQSIWIYREERR